MKRKHRITHIRQNKHLKAVKYHSDFQTDWHKLIPTLKNYQIQSVGFLTISGDAPKDFVIDKEYRPGHRSKVNPKDKYIAKVGSKYYPLESVMEQFITRIGQCFGLKIADSKLRIVEGQVRFLSKYFLKSGEQLTHGAEIYEFSLGKDNYAELAENKEERDFFTFQMTCEAIKRIFPDGDEKIIRGYVEMLTFDAIIGHNDRHPYNWGVIVPLKKGLKLRFAPVFDTARALFWNIPEAKVVNMLTNKMAFESYVKKCLPPVCWEKKEIDFFELIGLIWKEFSIYRESIEIFLDANKLIEISNLLDNEFGTLISKERRELIKKCLHLRQSKLIEAVSNNKKEL